MPPGSMHLIFLGLFLCISVFTECKVFSADEMHPQYHDEYPSSYEDDFNNVQDIYDNSLDYLLKDDRPQEENTPTKTFNFPMRMPSVSPKEKDTYLCYSYDFTKPEQDSYIVGFVPNATMEIAHHILMFGCAEPGHPPGTVWACGEMSGGAGNQYKRGPTCLRGSQTIYAWARNAPKLDLPDGVGFKVGRNSEVQYIVLQVHYANVDMFIRGGTDNSGITLQITMEPMPKLAGIYLLGTGGIVEPGESKLETECKIRQQGLVMHPFRFRTHTHSHGKKVTGYLIRNDKWTEIGQHDPLEPQMFYEVKNKSLVVENGDILAAQCIMENKEGHPIRIGATHKDEMCNFYLMYWSLAPTTCSRKYCFSNGPPYYSWKNDPQLRNVPTK